MKKCTTILLSFLLLIILINARAEKSTRYTFPEFSLSVSDKYLTFTKENVKEVVGSNTLFGDLSFFIDYFSTDNTLFLDAINPQSLDEICVKFLENQSGIDFRLLNDYEDSLMDSIIEGLKQSFEQNGFQCISATAYRHPQIVFIVLEGYQSEDLGYTIYYYTGAKIHNQFYTIAITGICNNKEKNNEFANDLFNTVSSISISDYPAFELPTQDNSKNTFSSDFELFDGEHFGKTYDEIVSHESTIMNVDGSVFEPPVWMKSQMPYITYSKQLTYDNIKYLGIEFSSKQLLFDENDIFYSAFFEFRSGYNLNLEGQDDINNFAPAYNTIELYLRDLYGNPQYQYKKGTKCDINGHGMNEMISLMGGLDKEKLYDYSEWVFEDTEGKIKIEHLMYFTGYIYKHNVSVEIIR